MRHKIIGGLLALAFAVTALVASPPQTEPAAAAYDCASWGCAETIYYWPSAGQWKGRVDDRWVSAHWTTSQSNVTACTYVKVRSANTGRWYTSNNWVDCGGSVATITIDMGFPIDKVRIESKDNRGRWRYLTVEG